jgi:hypothetical protein
MKFIYNKKIDEDCHKRLDACDNIFDEQKKTEVYNVTPKIIQNFVDLWTIQIEQIFNKGIHQIFKKTPSDNFHCYINSTPYSMDTSDGISISASITKNQIRMICHEMNHFMFRKSNFKDVYFPKMEIEDAKEVFVVINNLYFRDIMESQDMGWPKFWKERYIFLEKWIKEH